jgi:hypothetical protein
MLSRHDLRVSSCTARKVLFLPSPPSNTPQPHTATPMCTNMHTLCTHAYTHTHASTVYADTRTHAHTLLRIPRKGGLRRTHTHRHRGSATCIDSAQAPPLIQAPGPCLFPPTSPHAHTQTRLLCVLIYVIRTHGHSSHRANHMSLICPFAKLTRPQRRPAGQLGPRGACE